MVVFDVKVYEMETDLLELFKKITSEIIIDGLVWNNEPKILPIAFGMNKLQVGCIVEDVKVSVEDIYEKIEAWEDIVQSIDTVSFQKLWFRNIYPFQLLLFIHAKFSFIANTNNIKAMGGKANFKYFLFSPISIAEVNGIGFNSSIFWLILAVNKSL